MSEVISEELSDLLKTPWLVRDRGGIWIQGVSYFRIYTLNLCHPAFPCHCVESVLHSLKETPQPSNILHLQQGADRTAVLRSCVGVSHANESLPPNFQWGCSIIMLSRGGVGVTCLFWIIMITLPQHPLSSRLQVGPLDTSALLESVKHGCSLLFSSLGGWVLGWNESWKFRLLPGCTCCCLLASSVCALSVDYFPPHCQLLHVMKWGGGGRRKNYGRSDPPSSHPLVHFFHAQNSLCHQAESEPGGWRGVGKRGKRTGPKVIYNHRQLDHLIPKWYFLKISSFIPEVFLTE